MILHVHWKTGAKSGCFTLVQPREKICKQMPVGDSHTTDIMCLPQESGERVNHEKSSEERVWVTSSLKPSMQCQKVAEKAMQTLDVVKRTYKHVTKYHCLVVTLTLSILDIRPHLKVCVQACCPSLARH